MHLKPAGLLLALILSAAATPIMLGAASPAAAQQPFDTDQPTLVTADEITYSEELDTVTARGSVELSQGDRILRADRVTYNRRANLVTATGDVTLLEATGEVIFANYVELTGDMKDGFARDMRVLLTDNSRLAGASGTRVGGTRSILRKGVFSPCDLCAEDPGRPPLWQLKAERVVHDETSKDVIYNDATLEFFGVPVAYTPYFRHPDPTVERRSGILAPTYGFSEDLGVNVGVPYYWAIAPDKDATLEPVYFSREGIMLKTDYRQRFGNGMIDFAGSLAYVDNRDAGLETGDKDFEGHIDGTGEFHLSDTWRAGFDVERTSLRTYQERYNIGDPETLTSRAYAERLDGLDFFRVETMAFQGLRSFDVSEETPLIAPFVQYATVGHPGPYGGRVSVDAEALSLTREIGADQHRFSLLAGYELPYIGPIGDVYRLRATLQSDLYYAEDATNQIDPGAVESGFAARFFPQIGLEWGLPFVKQTGNVRQVIEPTVQLVAAPSGSTLIEVSNEDSQALTVDDSNLFLLNRYTGYDRVSGGSRIDYGIKYEAYGRRGSSSFFLGQSYRLQTDNSYLGGSGLEDNASDIVGRIRIAPSPNFTFNYRFRFDAEELSATRNEIGVAGRLGPLSLATNYVLLDDQLGQIGVGSREEVSAAFTLRLTDYWSLAGRTTQSLGEDDGGRDIAASLTYQDECFLIAFDYERDFTEDIGIEPRDAFFIRFYLKHLGGFGTN
ncbi:MAG: LPS assembly protein LptD [Alphaproteobacteria bacterium]|nr:LPS assembly protein LptD [Alphaproteobacteria bacterium]